MNSYLCPYCRATIPLTRDTLRAKKYCFDNLAYGGAYNPESPSLLELSIIQCPSCNEFIINIIGIGESVSDVDMMVRPLSNAIKFPDYVPLTIRQDYEEACAIQKLSPKSAATLLRRCLQAMIRDFWGIKNKKTLSKEIEALEDKVPAAQWKAIDAIRSIGNIGAHPERDINCIVDVEPGEVEKLIKLIEILIEQWYIDRHQQEQLYQDIQQISATKKNQ